MPYTPHPAVIWYPAGSDQVSTHTDLQQTATTAAQAVVDVEVRAADTAADAMAESVARAEAAADRVARTREEDDVAYTVVFEDGRRTWLESTPAGRPTGWARTLIVEAVEPYIGGGSGGGGQAGGQRVAGGSYGDIVQMWTEHPHPRGRLVDIPPLLTLAESTSVSIGYPHLFYDRYGDMWLAWSTEHTTTYEDSGTWAAKFNPDGPEAGIDKSTIQKIYLSPPGGAQHETPRIEWLDGPGEYAQLYSKGTWGSAGRGAQSTFLATAPEITGPWTDHGVIAQMESRLQPGDGHTGYLYPYRIGGRWYASSRYGGRPDSGRWGFWYGSDDWRTWEPDPRNTSEGVDVLEHFDWYEPDTSSGMRFQPGNQPFKYNGALWVSSGISGATIREGSGAGSDTPAVIVTLVSEDLMQPCGLPVELTNGVAAAPKITHGGRAYGVSRLGGPATTESRFVLTEVY